MNGERFRTFYALVWIVLAYLFDLGFVPKVKHWWEVTINWTPDPNIWAPRDIKLYYYKKYSIDVENQVEKDTLGMSILRPVTISVPRKLKRREARRRGFRKDW